MTVMETKPQTAALDGGCDDDLDHVVSLENEDVSLCGLDMTEVPWAPDNVLPDDSKICVVCWEIAKSMGLPTWDDALGQ